MSIYSILGNLVVLGFVGIILVLFRKSDKNSKSLEQVKKYAQRRNEEFDLYVDEKMTQLKDLSVSLEVQEKTGTVILNRISGEVDILSEQITHIEDLKGKVTGYNSTMENMLSLSEELEGRYTALKKDSGYLDLVDKRVKDGRKKLQTIEKSIDDITSEFIKNNNNSVNKLKDELLKQATSDVDALGSKLNHSSLDLEKIGVQIEDLNNSYVTGAKDNLGSFKEDLNRLVESHRESIVKITSEGQSLEEASFTEIKDKINNRSSNLITILEEKLKGIEQDNNEKISKLSMDMGNVEVIANKIKEENKARLDSIKVQLDKQLHMLKDVNSKGIKSLHDEFDVNFNEFKDLSLGDISRCRNESLEIIAELQEDIVNAKDYKDEVIDKYTTTESYINSELNELKDRFENSITEVTKELENHEDSVKKAAFKHLESNMDEFKNEIDTKLEDLTSVNKRIDIIKEEFNESISNGRLELQEDFSKVKVEFTNDKNQLLKTAETLKDELKDLSDVNRSLISQEKDNFVKSVESLKVTQQNLSKELYDGEKEIRNQVVSQRETLLTNVYKDIDGKITGVKDELTIKLNSVNETLLTKLVSEKTSLDEFIENFNLDKNTLEDEIKKLKESSYNTVSKKLSIFEDEYFVKLKEKEDYIESETERWHSQLEQAVKKIEDESISSIVENMETVNSRVKTFQDELTVELNSFRHSSEKKLEELILHIQLAENKLTIQSDEFKVKVESDIVTLDRQINSINNEVITGSQALKTELSLLVTEQKKYISETEIFTRTDQLRDDLSKAVVNLSHDLEDVKEKSEFVTVTNEKLGSLRSLIENINKQIESTDSKRIKIESLESRVSKVLDLSDSVDVKLTKIKESEEQIGEIQLKLRELKELENSVTSEFDRLEKKEDLLTETNRSIDTGFGQIQLIEGKLDLLKESLNPFNNQIENIQGKLDRVEGRESKIDLAINTLSTLDESVNELEEKIVKMDKAREWIAGVETRLDESVRSAEEQVKLMGALAQSKNDKTSVTNSAPAPNMNMRDMVIKLAHQGWKSDAISKTTKLSRGEVELILELSPRK